MISLAAPRATLTFLSLPSEARRAAALAHRAESDGEVVADGEAAADGEVAAEGVLPDEEPLDPHPASNARPHAVMTSFHRPVLVAVPGLMVSPGSRAGRHPCLTRRGLFPRSAG